MATEEGLRQEIEAAGVLLDGATTETKAKMSARPAPIRAGRDSRGRFIKGNIPLNKRARPT